MAEQQQPPEPANKMGATYPIPPPYWQSFTSENLARLAELRRAQAVLEFSPTDAASLQRIRLLDLPPELRCLQIPEPPAHGKYRLFGENYDIDDELPSLEEMGIEQLYDTPQNEGDHNQHGTILKKMAKSMLLNFMELIGIMSVNPDHYEEKIQDLRTLFINFHHLLNEYRPHQARESLTIMMKEQLERSRAETEGIMKMKAEVEDILKGLVKIELGVKEEQINRAVVEDKEIVDSRNIWEELEREFS